MSQERMTRDEPLVGSPAMVGRLLEQGAARIAKDRFNRLYPIGAEVDYMEPMPGGEIAKFVVRSEAFISESGHPVAFFVGKSGYYSVYHVRGIGF